MLQSINLKITQKNVENVKIKYKMGIYFLTIHAKCDKKHLEEFII